MRLFRPIFLVMLVQLSVWPGAYAVELPTATELIKKVLNSSKETAAAREEESKYVFDRLSISEEFDPDGKTKLRKEKLSEVRLINGIQFTHLLKVNGKPLTEQEQIRRKAHEKKAYQQARDKKESHQDFFVSEDIISRFTFAMKEIEIINGRNAFVITFKPKTNDLPAHSMEDRIVNRLTGTVWIDAQEYEFVQLECRLSEKTGIWGGLLGSIQELHLTLQRRREGAHIWFNEVSQFEVRARKLLENFHLKVHEVASNFRKVPLEETLSEFLK